MEDNLKQIIQNEYGISILNIGDAPRQFVADTYILECRDATYFCKVVNKHLFIPSIVESLPVLHQLNERGFEKLNYPIPTKSGKLYLLVDNTLIVLFNYIDAKQSQSYDFFSLGKLIATIHSMTNRIDVPIARENFTYRYEDVFNKQLKQVMENDSNEEILRALTTLVAKYLDEINYDHEKFLSLCKELRSSNHNMVITHGDPGGNILVTSPTDLYLIDWDSVLLAPPERDTWFFQQETDFLLGYRSIFSEYKVNDTLNRYFTYKRYFEDLVEYFEEILGAGTETHRKKNLLGLEHDCFEGWLRPAIRKFDPYS